MKKKNELIGLHFVDTEAWSCHLALANLTGGIERGVPIIMASLYISSVEVPQYSCNLLTLYVFIHIDYVQSLSNEFLLLL